ncbi:MAG: hypothetical protein MPEBLZ_02768 [Candidatus Methanoperedens nitroreducens]|uniref:Uncharacterized protein n=1 Tax=Candidatus Methanoperedens nitratireducens TaxID=1392998 RepID=A0A0P8C7E1_9EURY|nr:hypothetical protein [Candidatus Methanoperedens sp. BLZ2]KAB2947364.1 MAG: hypothetical protein F9K14_04720 [Candidatus Methanoperedens sp.]KPQ42673.1 MAG: hypothetical protein MPEBLZ_02768 [Candidatus Methanoperedens sp. BLZ1]MBZ0175492.1 hypothetical protein [Candidatus Methanoperedens nitroreducens]CAG0957951.1 hypothetical protein METP2_00611 [Methanosarcinales archaeon]VVB55525.1 Uncharacterised protein [uncultured archaeon]
MTENMSVKISSDAKIILDTMYQQLRNSGIKITEKKILDTLISNADIATIKKLLKKEDNTALLMLKKPVYWGVADSSEDIDRYLYGNP